MQLIYEGKDITGYVNILKCVFKDVSFGRSDMLELELDHAAKWYAWEPAQNDTIRVIHMSFDTGTLYLNTLHPENGKYRIYATSIPSAAQRKAWASFENMTLDGIFAACGAECAMDKALYGLDEAMLYPYLMRKNEGCAAFLSRLMEWEGAVMKAVNKRLTGIGILYAQDLQPRQTVKISAEQDGITHTLKTGMKYAGITIRTPYAEATAIDTGVDSGDTAILTDIPAGNAVIAGRWARGLLLHHNRRAETLRIANSEFNTGLTAMARINIQSETGMKGKWIVDTAEHDMIENKTTATLLRCQTTIR